MSEATASHGNYRRLDPSRVIETAERLERRVNERFPGSGLGRVTAELVAVARESVARADWITKPNLWLRLGIFVLIAALVSVCVALVSALDLRFAAPTSFADAIQGLDAGMNVLVFLSIAIFFLVRLEARFKRAKALQAIHELRSIAHIIDMHQLTKDPERILTGASDNTQSSPERAMTPPQLARYLDYSAESLAIISKIAALHAEHFNDPVALGAVDEVEDLVSGLSRKIWQKINIIVDYHERSPGPHA